MSTLGRIEALVDELETSRKHWNTQFAGNTFLASECTQMESIFSKIDEYKTAVRRHMTLVSKNI